ncbi:hypothetical protein [Shewanella woodyi]|uniref:Uncharacterized protein n=1 Tax=Shewanella woodyi (strain ATCC 51908 / MS32) TaxID=392500 RepID=B1KJ98_SHEWM|nr:hypothetical protein [Shewanella woodyi]ACA88570.1 conserved hypothetical protein [Shewanella woodyi ATCC 51908]
MKLLTSVTLSAVFVFASTSVLAEKPDFSKTTAAQASYDFSKNKPATGNQLMKSSTRHDFSKTAAASSEYQFSKNTPAKLYKVSLPSTQHDFSKTSSLKQGC